MMKTIKTIAQHLGIRCFLFFSVLLLIPCFFYDLEYIYGLTLLFFGVGVFGIPLKNKFNVVIVSLFASLLFVFILSLFIDGSRSI